MSRTRPWWIIGAVALAQLAVIVGYYGLLSTDGISTVEAQTVVVSADPAAPPDSASPALQPVPQVPFRKDTKPRRNEIMLFPLPEDLAAGEREVVLPPIPVPNASFQTPPPPLVEGFGESAAPIILVSGQDKLVPLPIAPGISNSNAAKASICPWVFTVEVVEGRTRLTAQDGPTVQFTIDCDTLDMRTGGGLVQAAGNVEVKATNLDGVCDRLTINWQDDAITLVNARLKCNMDGRDADLQSPQLRLQMSINQVNRQLKPKVEAGPETAN
jgi:hypothetical protein